MKNPYKILATKVPEDLYELVERQLLPHESKSKYVAEAIRRELIRRG